MAPMPPVPDKRRGLAGRTVLAVLAHPDDESLACGGTLARLSDGGARVVLLCASRGERGMLSDSTLVDDGNLGRVRTQELHEAARVLGIADVLVCDHPDGSLRWADVPEFQADIVSTLLRFKPDAVITFDEDGLYWHLDHIGVHERTSTAVQSLGADAPPLYYVTMPHGAMRALVDAAVASGRAPLDAKVWGITPDAFGLQTEPPTFTLDVGDWVPRKLAALRCHRTQMGQNNPFTWIDDASARRLLGIEQFRRAQPQSGPSILEALGDPVLGSRKLRV